MPYTQNNSQNPPFTAQILFQMFFAAAAYQLKEMEYIEKVWKNLYAKPQYPLLELTKKKQKLIDQVYEYVAPSLFVTSVLASGELVGSTIWGISKYVSKDIIWNTLGATTSAVILQSADLVGYREEAQKLFGIKNTGRRATLAIAIGGQVGKALGAVAGTALSVLIESAAAGVVAPTLLPLVIGIGFFTGQRIGEVVGAGLGAGLNNLFFSTIGTLPASYKGIKQKGGKFVERIKRSSEEKHKRAQKANNAAVPGLGESGASSSPVPDQNAQNNSTISRSPANLAIVQQRPSSAALAIPPVVVVQNAQEPAGTNQQSPAGAGLQAPAVNQQIPRDSEQKLEESSVPSQNQQPDAKGGKVNKDILGQYRKQPGQDNKGSNLTTQQKQHQPGTKQGHKKKPEKNPRKTGQPTPTEKPTPKTVLSETANTINKNQDKQITSPTTDLNNASWTVVLSPQQKRAQKQQEAEARRKAEEEEKTQKKRKDYLPIKATIKLPGQNGNKNDAPPKDKFTSDIPPKNAIKNALNQGGQNKKIPHAKNPRNKSGGNLQRTGRSKN